MLSIIISFIFYLSINSVFSSLSENQTSTINQLTINIEFGENETILLLYNVTTNSSYLITFRFFGKEQLQFGWFPSTSRSLEHSLAISELSHTTDTFYLCIICFHFLLQVNELDIQCKDIRLPKTDAMKSNVSKDFLPSYNPLFVPMMYALSVIMLLPVMIQHHRQKKALLRKRQSQLRRLSITIANDDQHPHQNLAKKVLNQWTENQTPHYQSVSASLEPISMATSKSFADHAVENGYETFVLHNLQSLAKRYSDKEKEEQSGINADDCVAHLLNSTPWNNPGVEQTITTSPSTHSVVRDSTTTFQAQQVSTIISFHDGIDDDDDRKPILKPTTYSRINSHWTNRAFLESDV